MEKSGEASERKMPSTLPLMRMTVSKHSEKRTLREELDSFLLKLESATKTDEQRSCEARMLGIIKQVLRKNKKRRLEDQVQGLLLEWVLPKKKPKPPSVTADQDSVYQWAQQRLDFWESLRCVEKRRHLGCGPASESPKNTNAPPSPDNSRRMKRILAEGPRPLPNEKQTLAELAKFSRAARKRSKEKVVDSSLLQTLPSPSVSSDTSRRSKKKDDGPMGAHALDAEYQVDRASRATTPQTKLPAIPSRRVWFDGDRQCESQLLIHQRPKSEAKEEVSLWDLCRGETQGYSFFQPPKKIAIVEETKNITTPDPFTWLDIKSTANVNHPENYGTESYFDTCLNQKKCPQIPYFLIENSTEVTLSELSDDQLDAVSASLVTSPPMESIDLQFNMACSDLAFARFMQKVLGESARRASRLLSLDLSNNKNISALTIDILSHLLQEELISLETLHLNCIHFSESSLAHFCRSLVEQGQVRELGLSSTKIGQIHNSENNVAKLLKEMSTLRKVHLSYNSFSEVGFKALGEGMQKNEIEWLDLSGSVGFNVRSGIAKYHPLLPFLELLRANNHLKHLYIAATCFDFSCAFLLEFIAPHSVIDTVDLSQNALGAEGLRCLLRCLVSQDAPLYWIHIKQFRSAGIPENAVPYESHAPCRVYELDLAHPQHRALLLTLAQRGEKQGQDLKKTFRNCVMRVSNKDTPVPIGSILEKKTFGWCCKRLSGALETTFVLDQTDMTTMKDAELNDPVHSMTQFLKARKICVNLTSFAVFVALFRTLQNAEQRTLFFEAMSKDFMMKPSQVRFFIKEAPYLTSVIIRNIFHSMKQTEKEGDNALFSSVKTAEQEALVAQETKLVVYFNSDNPTDHYRLDLKNPQDRGLYERLVALSVFDRARYKSTKLPDISQHGTRTGFRNATWDSTDVVLHPDWTAPLHGVLDFDYACVFKVSMLAATFRVPLGGAHFADLCRILRGTKRREVDQCQTLRRVSHKLILTPAQVCQLVALLKTSEVANPGATAALPENGEQTTTTVADAFVMLFVRCCDHAALVSKEFLYNRDLFSPSDMICIQDRLGPIQTFDAPHCSDKLSNVMGNTYSMDLAVFENRTWLNYFLNINIKEEIMQKCGWSEQEEKGNFTVPISWMRDIPDIGIFFFVYKHAEEKDINMPARVRYATDLLAWPQQ